MKNRRRFSGQSLIEFALIFPIILFLMTGFLDLGRAIFYYSSLTSAVREATRYAIVHRDDLVTAFDNPADNTLQDKVLEFAFGLTDVPEPLEKTDVTVTVEKEGYYFSTVSISASYMFRPVTPGIKLLFGLEEGFDLNVQSKMYVTPGAW